MTTSHDPSTYHSRFCALRNMKVSLIFFLFCAIQVFLRWRELDGVPEGGHRSIVFYVALVAVIAVLADFMVALKCFRERLVLGLAMASFLVALTKGLFSRLVVPVTAEIREFSLLLWFVASLVSLSLLYSAFRGDSG